MPDEDKLDTSADTGPDARSQARQSSRPARRRREVARLTAAQAAAAGSQQIADLTGRQPEGVTGVEPGEDGWIVGVEVVEDHRIPSSADILATYEIEVDGRGELLSYRRTRRYTRGRGDGGLE
jgi:hypothetical protein